jgi:hypothetical protein
VRKALAVMLIFLACRDQWAFISFYFILKEENEKENWLEQNATSMFSKCVWRARAVVMNLRKAHVF